MTVRFGRVGYNACLVKARKPSKVNWLTFVGQAVRLVLLSAVLIGLLVLFGDLQAATLINRGNASFREDDYATAIDYYSRVLQAHPDHVIALTNRAAAYTMTGQYEAAAVDYSTVIRLEPENAFAYSNRGLVYAKAQQYESALFDYATAIRVRPDLAATYYYRALLYIEVNRREQALADLQMYLSLESDPVLRETALLKIDQLR